MCTRIQVSVAVLSALATAVVAVPAKTLSVPEVIPGPGLPSLASLNLTSAQLYAMGPPPALGVRARGFTPACQTAATAATNDVIACFNYLTNIGNNACTVAAYPGVVSWFCEAGTAAIAGWNIANQPIAVSSTCYDVALGVQWVFAYCDINGQVGGYQAAYGNGGLVVAVDNISLRG